MVDNNTLARQETAREAYNDYIQYLWIFEELGAKRNNSADENAADNPDGNDGATIPLTRATMPLKSFLRRKP